MSVRLFRKENSMMRRIGRSALIAVAGLIVLSTSARAQSAIAGVVRDSSGGVLPGVTVEASSDALIEKSRSATTDGQGQFRIVDLRPGKYVVTFSLSGFQSVRREGIDLPTNFTATVSADLQVGSLEESITVSGDSPVVDTHTAVHSQVLNRETLDAIPTGHTTWAIGQLIVGVNLSAPDVGGSAGMQQTYMSTHGMATANTIVQIDGLMVNGLQSDGGVQAYSDQGAQEEVSYQTAGAGADVSGGGVRVNIVQRAGGNTFTGSLFTDYRPGQWQADNLTDRLKATGLKAVGKIDRIYDIDGGEGGPIAKDRLWFFSSGRFYRVNAPIADTFYADGRQGIDDQYSENALVRLTWQVSPRVKYQMHYERINKFRGHAMTAGTDPDTASLRWGFPVNYQATAKLSSTVTSRLLMEGGFSTYMAYNNQHYQPGVEQTEFSPEWYARASRVDLNLVTRTTAGTSEIDSRPERYYAQASASYVTGSHNIKVGFLQNFGTFRHGEFANADLYQQYRNGVPDSVLVRNTPLDYAERLNADFGVYGQDSWTLRRLTLNAGLRWEYLNAQVSDEESPAGRFAPARHFDRIPDLPNWKDLAPRFSVVYDVFGNSKTAVKFLANRYNQARTTGFAANYNPLASVTATLRWTDLNKDDIAQGTLNCQYQSAGCEIDYSTLPANFGTLALTTPDPNLKRPYDLETGLDVQHQLLPRLSLSGAWYRGAFHRLPLSYNTQTTFSDYAAVSIFNPIDGTPITVYNLNPAKASALAILDTSAGSDRQQTYNLYQMEFRTRLTGAATFFGGISAERTLNVKCDGPDNPNLLRFCDDGENGLPFLKSLKLAGSYGLPWGVQVSGAFQSQQGATTTGGVTYAITRTTRYPTNCPAPCPSGGLVLPSLTQSTLTVSLLPQGAFFAERINQLDLRASKTFKLNRVTVQPTIEAFNVTNADSITAYRSVSYATSAYLQPSATLQGRILGIGIQTRW
jgi:hypothetical protein